ncbi:hypothetical protein JKF63_06925 [Porcisia hertigi]|uniref:Uncharacterized protein n=1 Tax=Porcisia hertigi TaxID=2761500 RepID=A0A836LJD5_9TRYP|nr:hypothetical protein JKF63_06925 [Porcisia hertigi]
MAAEPHPAINPSMGSPLPSEPPCVQDVFSQLPPFSVAVPKPGVGGALNRPAVQCAEKEILPVPPAVVGSHRVQVSIRGRRYEMSMEVALASCLSFFVFFHWPFSVGNDDRDSAMCKGDATHAKRPLQTVGDAITAAAAPHDLAEEPHLLNHYTRVVEPVLHTFLDHWVTSLHAAAATQAEGECTSTAETKEAGDATPLPPLPPLPRPIRIAYDASVQVWKFEFAARLTATATGGCGDRSATAPLAAAEGNATATTDELNRSPFLLLQSDYMGVLLVYLRRCAQVRAARRAAAAADGATGALARYPTLPIRWAEMNYDEQLSFVQLLRCFGVVSLMGTYTHPTAPQSTSLYLGTGLGSAAVAAAAASSVSEEDACSVRTCAARLTDVQQKEMLQAETDSRIDVVEAGEMGNAEGDISKGNAAGLGGNWKGCARCGMSTHSVEECPYV